MTPLLLKSLLLATLIVCFVPSILTRNIVEIDCSSFKDTGKKCPDFCPRNTRIQKMNPSSAYGALCVCCVSKEDEPEESAIDEKVEDAMFELPLTGEHVKAQEVSDQDRKAVLSVIQNLVKEKKLPQLEYKFWEIKIERTRKVLLTREEEDALLMLLMDCGIPWNNAFLLVHPLAGDRSEDVFGLRSDLDFGVVPE